MCDELPGGLSERRSNLLGVGSRLSAGFGRALPPTRTKPSLGHSLREANQTALAGFDPLTLASAHFAKLYLTVVARAAGLLSVVTSALGERREGKMQDVLGVKCFRIYDTLVQIPMSSARK